MQPGSEVTEHARLHDRGRLALSLLIVGVVALAVAWLGDPRAGSYSDVGGRIATVKTMADSGRWVPDVGYWAASVDSGGAHHPLLFTYQHGDNWVQVTSLPLVTVARPLWQLGGARAVVLIPVLSVVLAAYAARRLSRWASGGDGWLALWFVGLLSPAVFYGADFWEHAPALALALLGVTLVLEGGGRRAVLGGLALGLATVMRNDMALCFVALGVGALVVRDERVRNLRRWREVVSAAVAAALVLGVNLVVEKAVLAGGATGATRSGQRLQGAGNELTARLRDAAITSFGLLANEWWVALVLGAIVALGILLMASAASDEKQTSPSLGGVVGATVAWLGSVWRIGLGLAAVPGFLPAAPVAALGFFGTRTARERMLLIGAVVAMPLIWMNEWVGQHGAQWGGRYLLLPTSLLVVIAAAHVARVGPRPLVVALVGLGAVMSVAGMVWHIERTREVAQFAHDVLDAPDDVVFVSDSPHYGKEIGAWYGDHDWLSPAIDDGFATPEQLAATVAVAHDAGATEIDVIDSRDHPLDRIAEAPSYPGYRYESVRTTKFLWDDVVIRRYVAA